MSLEVKHLTHTYSAGSAFQATAVHDVSLTIEDGEFVCIVGHTGSGKSTLVQHLNGLLKPTSGQVLVDGEDMNGENVDRRRIRQKVGLVFQYPEYQLFEETVYKDIAFGPANQGKTGDELDHAVREAAKLVGIRDDQLEKSPFELSGGQKRRVAVAGVMAMKPRILVLDEPAAGMNPSETAELTETIRRIRDEFNIAVLLIEHDMRLVSGICDRLTVLNFGTVLAQGKVKDVLNDPEVVRAYLGGE